jgi:2-keto-3-deoxy-L-rhamnonate aldolase RhmA
VKRIVAAGRKHGKALGFMAADAVLARQYRDLGFNMIATGTDQGLLISGILATLLSVRED